MTQDFEAMRLAMVESQLRPNAVDDRRVIRAMSTVSREDFVPDDKAALAYAEMLLPLGDGRRMNLPLATARLLTEAVLSSDDHILIVGAAGGYTAALCARLVRSVVALEEDEALIAQGADALATIENVESVAGALAEGWAKDAPYDAIIVDGAIEHLPDALVEQLADGGRLVAAMVDDGVARLVYGRKQGGAFGTTAFLEAQSATLPGFERPAAFVF